MEYREEPDYAPQPPEYQSPFPPGLRWILIVTGSVFLVEFVLASWRPGAYRAMLDWFGVSFAYVLGRGCVWQFVTYAFLHDAFNIFHILLNMYVLFLFGQELEWRWGTRRFIAYYLSAAVFAGLLFIAVDRLANSNLASNPCIGASGAVMAVLMAFALLWPRRVILFMFVFPMRIRTFAIITVILEIVGALNLRSNIAHSAHLGGLFFGWAVVHFGPALEQRLSKLSVSRRDPGADTRRLDALLEKVHREGFRSLSWRERRFLQKMSRQR